MIKAVIFDIGGVLRENTDVKKFWKGKKEAEKLRHDLGTGKLSTREFIKSASNLLGVSQKEFIKRYKESYETTRLKKDVFKILKKIKLEKYLLSDANSIYTKYEKKKFPQIFKEPNRVFLSQNIGVRKDKVRAFEHVLKAIKFKPEETVMIDDEQSNLDNAKKLGMNVILFENAKQLEVDLKELGINI